MENRAYKLICEADISRFNERINEYIKEGWKVHGAAFSGPYTRYPERLITFAFCQTMVKEI